MTPRTPQGKDTIELIEEAVYLLRLAPAGSLLAYYAGSLPFVLGLLYFWSDMSRSPFAERLLPVAALGQTLLFVWMKTFQAVFARGLLAQLRGEPAPRWTVRSLSRVALSQTILQPSGLFVLTLVAQILFPFAWVYAFYQNVTALGGVETSSVRALVRRAWRQAVVWPRQNHQVLLVLSLFGLFVFMNLLSAAVAGPFLLRTLLGIETAFTQSAWAMLNSTFLAAVLALTYLCLDPVLKAAYALRCFYGEALADGQDLRTDLARYHSGAPLRALAAALILLGQLALSSAAPAATPPGASEPLAPRRDLVSAGELNRAIEDVIQRREYTWRMPREKMDQPADEKNVVVSFLESIATAIDNAMKKVGRWLRELTDWLGREREWNRPSRHRGLGWAGTLQGMILALGLVLVVLLAWLVIRMCRSWLSQKSQETAADPVQPSPDLTQESVTADQMPEDGWAQLAGELLERGELRLALRALYLSSLAHLAKRNLITLARFKSNREYERELERRSHILPDLLRAFSDNVTAFDRVWYGLHQINRERLDGFARNVERIKAQA